MLLLALLMGCVRDAPLPDLGPCSEPPDGVYEFGQIGIGTCLAGPTALRFEQDAAGNDVLLVTNANPYQVFTSGSLLSIPWDAIDLTTGRNRVDLLEPVALPLPTFSGSMAVTDDLGIITSRLSEDARVRQTFDDLHLVDLSDPGTPVRSRRGTDGGSTFTVQSDPVDVVVDESAGLAFVANRTSHSVSVIDVTGETLEIVLPWPVSSLTSAAFDDADGSGSTAELADLEMIDDTRVTDDYWTLTWIEGTFRLWLPEDDGLARHDTTLAHGFRASGLGVELDPSGTGGIVSAVNDPHYVDGRMIFEDGGILRGALADEALAVWGFEAQGYLAGRSGQWDAELGGPSAIANEEGLWLFYDGGGVVSPGIGVAVSGDAQIYARLSDAPLLLPGEGETAIADPFVFWDAEVARYRMLYGTWDGSRWALLEAHSSNLRSWTVSDTPALELPDADAAAPVVAQVAGAWHLWYSRRDATGDTWRVGHATSRDGRNWEDQGAVAELPDSLGIGDDPPGIALQAALTSAFRIEGEEQGVQSIPAYPGATFIDPYGGFYGLALAGAHLSPGDAGADSAGGVQVDSLDLDSGRAWLTLTSNAGRPGLGVATIEADGTLQADVGAFFEGGSEAFDRNGAASPVAVEIDGSWHLYYAGVRGAERTVGLLTSPDGESWTPQGQVLGLGQGFDLGGVVPGSVQVLDSGDVRLWYSGYDGEVWRIGSALSADGGRSFTREPSETRDYQFGTGSPGQWHDSGTRHPWVVAGEDADGNAGLHMWFAGFDGDLWRGGYAFRADGSQRFDPSLDEGTLEPRPIVGTSAGLFHPDGVLRPVVVQDGDRWTGFYAGLTLDETRVGAVSGVEPDRLATTPLRPTVGDTLAFSTERGDPSAEAIPLDAELAEGAVNGIGLIALTLDEERGYLYALSKLLGYFIVIDIRDDSGPAFLDLNYLDIEAVVPFNNSAGAQGFRQLVTVPGSDTAYAVNDQPEGIWTIDLSGIEDEAFGHLVVDTSVGWLPAPRGIERDQGPNSQSSVGPAQMVAHPDGRRLLLTNFNANSLTVYDLELGPHGQLVAEVPLLGESPYGITLTPDGRHAVIANFAGEVAPSGLAESTLVIVDVDEDSPTYLDVLTWVVNQ